MIERIYILCLIIIIKSEVWTITHCLGLGHETMVCAVCLSIFLCRMTPRDSCKPTYSTLGIMRFSDVNVYIISKLMFRVCKGDVLDIFRTYFTFILEIHNHFTRQCDYLHVPKSNLGKSNICYRGVIIWNHIISKGADLDISEAVFVKMVKCIVVNGMLKL